MTKMGANREHLTFVVVVLAALLCPIQAQKPGTTSQQPPSSKSSSPSQPAQQTESPTQPPQQQQPPPQQPPQPQQPQLPLQQQQQPSLQPQQQQQLPQFLPMPMPPQLSPQSAVLFQCRQATPLSTDFDLMELQREMLPSSQTGRCLLACAAQQLGYSRPNFPLEVQGASALAATLFPSRGFDPSFNNALMITVNQCLAQQAAASAAIPVVQLGQNLYGAARTFNPFLGR